MTAIVRPTAIGLLAYPYRHMLPVTGGKKQLKLQGRHPGSALIWHLGPGLHEQDANVVRDRPGGLPLIVVLPRLPKGIGDPSLLRGIEAARPLAVLPYHAEPLLDDLVAVLRKPPENLGVEVAEYLSWRGIVMDRETAQLVRRTVGLSADLRSITALCRSMYLSRRALGRRFLSRGLPVPSHWLHFARLLRVAIRLQNSSESVLSVGYELGYPDAFSLSNQMVRLTGHRPSEARRYLGWEWLVEAWLRREADTGGLAPDFTMEILAKPESRRGGGNVVRAVAERRAGVDPDPDRAA